jgi:hypothetical protein
MALPPRASEAMACSRGGCLRDAAELAVARVAHDGAEVVPAPQRAVARRLEGILVRQEPGAPNEHRRA